MFKEYKYGIWKNQIRKLLQERINLKSKIRYHKLKILELKNDKLPIVEGELNNYLVKAGNKLD